MTICNNVELTILVNGKKPIPQYLDPITKSVYFVEGRKGSSFTIQVKNNNFFRVCVLPSVDGLSTIDGKPANSDSPGYVIEPRSTIDIPGWTINADKISSFEFTDMSKSYSSEVMGSDKNVGVVGIMIFNEKTNVYQDQYQDAWTIFPQHKGPWINSPETSPMSQPSWFRSAGGPEFQSFNAVSTSDVSYSATASSSSPLLGSGSSDEHLGVGWGEEQNFKVKEVDFVKGNKLGVLEIHYDTRKNLEARGIEFSHKTHIRKELPKAFHFGCKPPRLWKARDIL